MNRRPTSAKHLVELYLIIVGGAYTLTAVVALAVNTRLMLQAADPEQKTAWSGDAKETLPILIPSALIFLAGIGVHNYRWWGLFLASGMGFVTLGYGVTWELSHWGSWDLHNFTIVLPMAAILVWAMLPRTWLEFKRQSVKSL